MRRLRKDSKKRRQVKSVKVAKAATGGRFAPNVKGEVRFESFFKLQETAGKYRGHTQKQKPRRARVRPRKSPPAIVDPQQFTALVRNVGWTGTIGARKAVACQTD